ncbi:MAG TPA: hypothetical protein VL588_01185 [Bdellovibrionota bacterium]|jgi:hypothetical protein|nr:hypothetical protein [Bdellovibrionota bacterium]
MSLKKLVLGVSAAAALALAPSVFAGSALQKACAPDLKKNRCEAKTDADAHHCLEKNEKRGKPNEGFTKKCYDAHEAYERSSGGETEEHHG